MYQNRIRRTANNLNLQSLIRRCDITFDERARYVEFVCAVWNEGRFGPDLADPVTIYMGDRPEPGSAEFYDLCDDGLYGPDLTTQRYLLPPGRASHQEVEAAYRRAMQMGLDPGPPVRNSPVAHTPNQGRGSP